MLECGKSEGNLEKSLSIHDETWVNGYDQESKVQLLHWKTPNTRRPKKAIQRGEDEATLFFDYKSIVYYEFSLMEKLMTKE